MDPSAGYHIIFLGEAEPAGKVAEQGRVYLPVVYKPCGAAMLAVLQPFFQLSDQVGGHIIVYLQLSIAGHLYDVAHKPVEPEWGEQAG